MAAPLATCTKEEQRSERMKPIEIHRRMKVQYGDVCLSLQQVYEWTKKFMNSIRSVCPRPGQAHRVVTREVTAAVETIMKENGRVTVNEIAAHLDISHGTARRVVCDVLHLYMYLMFNKFINILRFSFNSHK
jgi:hypothetical protein